MVYLEVEKKKDCFLKVLNKRNSDSTFVVYTHPLDILHDGGEWRIAHILREGNKTADSFAKYGIGLDYCSSVFRIVPGFASLAFRADATGISLPRGL